MEHLSAWHSFKVMDRETYPKVIAPIQVKFGDGETEVGYSSEFFPRSGYLSESSIAAWRYIKQSSMR